MSSNIKVQRICQNCGKEFTARTTVTKCCSKNCATSLYKKLKRSSNIERSNKETLKVKIKPIEELKAKEFLTVREVAILLNCSLRTTYRFINIGNLKATNLSERKTLVRRSDIEILFDQPKSILIVDELELVLNRSQQYSLLEVKQKFNISDSALHHIIKRNNIPVKKIGIQSYLPKKDIDELFYNIKPKKDGS